MQTPSFRQPQAAVPTYNRYLGHTRRQQGIFGAASSRTLTDGSGVPLPSWSRASATSNQLQYSRLQPSIALSANTSKAPLQRRRASLDMFSQPSSLENTFSSTANSAAPRRASVDQSALSTFRSVQLQAAVPAQAQAAAPKATPYRRPLKQSGPSRTSVFSRGVSSVSDQRPPLETLRSEEEDIAAFALSAWTTEAPSLQVYAKQLQDPKVGIPTKEQEVKGVCTRVFNGSDAAEWFMLSMDEVNTSDDAEMIGQKLIDMGLISSTEPEKAKFKVSSKDWYHFCHSSNYNRESVQPRSVDGTGTEDKSTSSQGKAVAKKVKKEKQTKKNGCTIL